MTHRAWRKLDGTALAELAVADVAPGDDRVLVAVEGAAVGPWGATPRGRVPGVAAVGRVIACGGAATEWMDARVLVPTLSPCGECDRCRRGGAAMCPDGASHGVDGPGALASALTAAARWLVRLDPPLDLAGPAVAALGGELALAYALYARIGVGPREPTIIAGGGVVARAAAAILAAKGAPVSADMSEHDVRRPRKVIVTDAARLAETLALAGPRATIAVLTAPGFGGGSVDLDLRAAMAQEITLTGVAGCHPDLVPELVALAVRGDLDLASMTEVVALDELESRLKARGDQPADTTLVVAMPSYL